MEKTYEHRAERRRDGSPYGVSPLRGKRPPELSRKTVVRKGAKEAAGEAKDALFRVAPSGVSQKLGGLSWEGK